jgi:hypothetical protein
MYMTVPPVSWYSKITSFGRTLTLKFFYNRTEDLQYEIFGSQVFASDDGSYGARIPSTVISSCLLAGLQDVMVDLNVFGNAATLEGEAIAFLEAIESESPGSVCDNPYLTQQYAATVLSFSGWFKPARNCEWSLVTCNRQGGIQQIGRFDEAPGALLLPISLLDQSCCGLFHTSQFHCSCT